MPANEEQAAAAAKGDEGHSAPLQRWGAVPAELRGRKQWLTWRFEKKPGQAKPAKMPYYVDGGRRQGKQGSEEDRRRLTAIEAAISAAPKDGQGGVGFAFLPGDGLIGIDLDAVIDLETGEIAERARRIIEACSSYTELSPSRRGVHIFVAGESETFKNNAIGVEVFCGRQFFTVTGEHYAGTPLEVRPATPRTLARLKATVRGARKNSAPAASSDAGGAADELQRIESALAYLAADEYNAWIETGHALKASLGEQGFALWDRWSSKSAKYPGNAETRRRWASFEPSSITVATIFKRAQDAGWKAPRPARSRATRAGERSAGERPSGEQPKAPIDWKAFFERFVLIYPTETAWDAELGQIVKVSAMKLAFGKGPVGYWLESPDRRTVSAENVVFDPAQKSDPGGTVNLFRGLSCRPSIEGSCRLLLELFQYLCGEAGQDLAPVTEYVLRWIAYPLRHPGAKMQTAIVMHGPEGTGKNLAWSAVNAIYGEYGTVITQFQLQSQFNDWASRKLFVVANEVVTRMELRHLVGYLKTLVTEPRIPIETKMMPARVEDNHMQLVFLSNELRPLHIAPGDRRYMVIRTPRERDASFYAEVAAELAGGGAARFYHYLLNEIDLGEFNEHTKPILTQAKSDLIEIGLSSTELFWQELYDGLLPLPYAPCLSEDLFEAYTIWCARNGERAPSKINGFSHEFMSMNGVSRRKERIVDPARPLDAALPEERRRQRKLFVMGERREDLDQRQWMQLGVEEFRRALTGFRAARSSLGLRDVDNGSLGPVDGHG
ncbi:MAG: PriCT-2 domain-containing protein [Betaproteobacteria bacterium]|nr:PriCT-2 domain-containing protein [Betaproteobacteria bacterium]